MFVAPIRFPGWEKEPPFDVAPIRKIIWDLLTQTADEVESEKIEIRSWCSNERELADKVAEACACLANTSGGFVIVGVADGQAARSSRTVPIPESPQVGCRATFTT
jgi:predicted HTH transcriptional regulator